MPLLSMFVVAAVTAALPPAGQQEVRAGAAYLEQVLHYHSGQEDAVTRALETWSADDLQLALRGLPAALTTAREGRPISKPTAVSVAMTMHIDIARRAEISDRISLHLGIGQRLSDLLPREQPASAFTARWHLLAGTVLFSLSRPADALAQFELARSLNPEDPEVLLAIGSVHETGRLSVGPTTESGEGLNAAIALYRAALAKAPNLHEARLRLARTHSLLGDLDAAADVIAGVDTRALSPHLRYLTVLIGGGIAEAAGRGDEAVRRYEEARALCRGCQSATLALSRTNLRAGNRAAAHQLVESLVHESPWPTPADPWWTYQQGQWHSNDRMFAQLRREVLK